VSKCLGVGSRSPSASSCCFVRGDGDDDFYQWLMFSLVFTVIRIM